MSVAGWIHVRFSGQLKSLDSVSSRPSARMLPNSNRFQVNDRERARKNVQSTNADFNIVPSQIANAKFLFR